MRVLTLPLSLLSRLVYAGMWLCGALLYLTPFKIKKAAAFVFARIWFYGLRIRRRVILHNLAAVFPREEQEGMNEFRARCEALAKKNLEHMSLVLCEIFERFHWSDATVFQRVRTRGLENAMALQKQGQGYFFLTAHLGNWELISRAVCGVGLRLAIITKFLRNPFFDALWVRARRAYGLRLLEERNSAPRIVKTIKEGWGVGFILDQHTGEPIGIQARFLGLEAWCPKGLAILATRLEAPIIPTILMRNDDGSWDFEIGAPVQFPALGTYRTESGALSEAGLRYHVECCNAIMERWIKARPEQYLWMHKRFKGSLDYRSPLVWQL